MPRPTVEVREEIRKPSEWLEAADELSQRVVRLKARDAYARVRDGEYEGTPFASKLSQLMFLAGEDEPLPRAAE
jgi:hypothetical protein